MPGWAGRILVANLSDGTVRPEPLDPDMARDWLGGRGMGVRHMAPFAGLAWDDPDAPLGLFVGPLTATIAPTSGRGTLVGFSPLTGTLTGSSLGGALPTQLKRAGWDGVVFTGRARRPVGLEICDGEVGLARAGSLAGRPTSEIMNALAGFNAAACVGPAAWNGVRFASLVVDRHHAAGRTGLGLTMATKNLAYIAVSGSGRTLVADRAELLAARQEIIRLTMASSALMGQRGFARHGTGALFDLMDARGMMPTDNFARTRFADAGRLNAHAYEERYDPESCGCKGCHILCKKRRSGAEGGGAMPEFETMSHFTALIGNSDPDLVMAANQACNEYGLDTISTAGVLACYREIMGRDFEPGQVLELMEDLATGRAPLLARGSAALARSMGEGRESMSVKGLDLPAYDPRGACGMALAYAVSSRGGCHLRAYPLSHEILRKPVATDRFSFAGKARIIKIAEDQNAVVDSLTACTFTLFAAGLEEYARALSAVTGMGYSAQELLGIGERICYQERMINAARGFTAGDDDLPARFFERDGDGVPALDREAFLAARANYYKVRGLDGNGLPTREKAEELGVAWILS